MKHNQEKDNEMRAASIDLTGCLVNTEFHYMCPWGQMRNCSIKCPLFEIIDERIARITIESELQPGHKVIQLHCGQRSYFDLNTNETQ